MSVVQVCKEALKQCPDWLLEEIGWFVISSTGNSEAPKVHYIYGLVEAAWRSKVVNDNTHSVLVEIVEATSQFKGTHSLNLHVAEIIAEIQQESKNEQTI